MEKKLSWSAFKSFASSSGASCYYIEFSDHYEIFGQSGMLMCHCELSKDPSDTTDLYEFEADYKPLWNYGLKQEVKTQFERDDLTIKMAKVKETVVDGEARIELLVPGEVGSTDGRYLAGGFGMLDTYDPDDHIICTVEDVDRVIAWQIALAQDPEAVAPVSDATVQALGTYPNYPIVGSYTEEECGASNEGWYFWPCARGGNDAAIGEIELEPLGFYGFIPSGFYLVFTIIRPNVSGGTIRGDIIWGKREV